MVTIVPGYPLEIGVIASFMHKLVVCGKICGKILKKCQIGTKIGVVVGIDPPIIVMVCGSSLW